MEKESLPKLLKKSLESNWNRNVFSDYHQSTMTYAELGGKIVLLHHLFKALDVKKGDKIALVGRNMSSWATVYLATVTYGAVIVPILPDFNTSDIHHIVNHSDARLLFTTDNIYDKIDETKMPDICGILSLEGFVALVDNCKGKLIDSVKKTHKTFGEKSILIDDVKFESVHLEDLAVISYTSGTSGFSKGVMLSHRSIWSNARIGWDINIDLRPGDRIVSFLPLAHAYGCLFEFLTPVLMGCHITFLTRTPSPRIITQAFQEIKPKLVLAVPLIIEKIYKKQIVPAIDKKTMRLIMKVPVINSQVFKKINQKLTTVFGGEFQQVIVGGAALNKDVEYFLRKIGFRFTIGYGMTECGPLISYSDWKNHVLGSAGKVVVRMEARVDSPNPLTIPGEILVKGDNVMDGYYKNEDATREVLSKDGWLRTGDLGVIDENNIIYIRGRSKNMILGPSGQNIYPEEIEAKLSSMPYVQECVVREKNGKLEALVYADYEAADSEKLGEKELNVIMKENLLVLNKELPNYMNVARIELYPEEFKKTPKKSIKRYLYT